MTDNPNMRNTENYQQKASQNLRAEAKNEMDNNAINNRFWNKMAEELAEAKNDYAQIKANKKD